MLSTILSQIESDIKKDKSLERHLPGLIECLQSQRRIVLKNMNDKQKLSQLQQLIQDQLNKINSSLTLHNIDLDAMQLDQEEDVQHMQSQEQGEQIDNEDNEDQNQQQDQISQQEADIQNQENIELEQGIQDQQFNEPQFDQNIDQEQQGQEQNNQQIEEQDQAQNQSNQNQDYEFQEEADVGLYGEELNQDDQDMEDYANEYDQEEMKEFQKQFGQQTTQKNNKKTKKNKNQQENDNIDDNIEDNFDHFRQLQIENQKEEVTAPQKTELDNQIDRLEGKIIGKKDWAMKGQVKARQRPSNSLLQFDLQFSSGIKYAHQITEQRNSQLQELIKKRILTDMFDDRTRFVNTSHIREHFGSLKQVSREKSQMGLGELYESQFKNFLGIGDNKNQKLKSQIMNSFKELNYFLDSLSNFSFTPKPTKDSTKKGQSQAIIVEEKVPLTLWNGQKQITKDNKMPFESQKQVDNQAKRLKNKRISRQRKKQQLKKKLNKKIQYGGITKVVAQAKQKALMNNKPLKIDGANMKYNKSGSFFKNMNQNKGGKPNADISKMKI